MLNWWYGIIDFILPFQWASHAFMKNALTAVLLVTPLFGILGTMIVNNRMAFFSDSLGHGAFTGIAIGSMLGVIKPIWGAIIFSVAFAILITTIKNKTKTSTDTIIGVFSSTTIAAGLVLITLFNQPYNTYLVGDLLSITPSDIALLLIVFVLVVILWVTIFNKLLVISVNPLLASSRGINTMLIDILFTSAVAVIVTITIQWVGILIINSLLVLPAAAARNIASNTRQYHALSIAAALISGLAGLIASYYLNTATGATIVLIAALLYFITLSIRGKVLK